MNHRTLTDTDIVYEGQKKVHLEPKVLTKESSKEALKRPPLPPHKEGSSFETCTNCKEKIYSSYPVKHFSYYHTPTGIQCNWCIYGKFGKYQKSRKTK